VLRLRDIGSLTWMWADVTNFLSWQTGFGSGWACGVMDPTGASYRMYQGFSTKTVPGLQPFIHNLSAWDRNTLLAMPSSERWSIKPRNQSRLFLRDGGSLNSPWLPIEDLPDIENLPMSDFQTHVKVSQGAQVFWRRLPFSIVHQLE